MTINMRRVRVCRFASWGVLLFFAGTLVAQTASVTPQTPLPTPIQAPDQTPAAPGWKPYSYPADGFTASFPTAPDVKKESLPTDAGSFELRSYIAQDGDVAMFVGVCDYGSKTTGKDPDTLLQGAKDGALENSKSKLVSEKKITFGIYPGLAYEAESGEAHFSARIYIVGGILYQTLVVFPLGKPYADATRFLDSFQLIPRVQG